jgi:dephospho-CoA kinase
VKVLGLTGGIATGKSTVAGVFRAAGIPVFDADAQVHHLLAKKGEAVAEITALFPDAIIDGMVDRKRLGTIVFSDSEKLKQLEAILHPKVRVAELGFIEKARAEQRPFIVLEIPLLFETNAHQLCDLVLVTHCDAQTQHQRIMARPGMTEDKMQQILARQMDSEVRNKRADIIIDTGQTLPEVEGNIQRLIKELSI